MKKILIAAMLFLIGLVAHGQLQLANVGTGPGTGTGETLRSFAIKTNAAFTLLNYLEVYKLNTQEMQILNGALVKTKEFNMLVGIDTLKSIQTQFGEKQATLISGVNLRTINGNSLLGSTDLVITGGTGSMVYPPGSGIPLVTGGVAWSTTITNNSANWNTAYGWGNHASAGYVTGTPWALMGYLTAETSHADVVVDGDFISNGILSRTGAGTYAIVTNNSTNWNTAYGWGNHAGLYRPIAYVPTWSEITGKPTTFNPTAHTQTQNTITALSDSLLARYTKTQMDEILALYSGGALEARVDSIVAVLADSANIEAILQIDFDTDTVASLSAMRDYVDTHGGTGVSGDTIPLVDLVPLLVDDAPIFVFGMGSGMIADIGVFVDGAIAGAFYYNGQHTLKITSLTGVLAEGNGTETISVQISWHATFKSGSATTINAAPLAITSITTGTTDTSFTNDEIPPGVWVWCTLSGASAGNEPSLLILTMSGHKLAN